MSTVQDQPTDDSLTPDDDRRFRDLFTSIDEGYCLCEIIVGHTGIAIDYRFLETNPLFEEMTGLHDAVGRTAKELVPGLEDHWVETYARAAIGRERLRFEQGSEAMGRWFDVFTTPVGDPGQFAIVFKDDTKRHSAEVRLRASEQRYRDLAEHEHRISMRLQRALLPESVAEHPRLCITACYEASETALEVGGDWYDTFTWSNGERADGRIGVMVGDVAGHDLDAAVAMGRLRAGVAALAATREPSPAALVQALDQCARGPQGVEFVTACAVVIDPDAQRLWFATAGHPPALVVGPDGTPRWLDDVRSSPPLGTLPLRGPDEACIEFPPGSVLVMYSDGLIERNGQTLDDGLNMLRRHAIELAASGEGASAEALVSRMHEPTPPTDDVVAVWVTFLDR